MWCFLYICSTSVMEISISILVTLTGTQSRKCGSVNVFPAAVFGQRERCARHRFRDDQSSSSQGTSTSHSYDSICLTINNTCSIVQCILSVFSILCCLDSISNTGNCVEPAGAALGMAQFHGMDRFVRNSQNGWPYTGLVTQHLSNPTCV